jgi:hypothetical protein
VSDTIVSNIIHFPAAKSKDVVKEHPPIDFTHVNKVISEWNNILHAATKSLTPGKPWCSFRMNQKYLTIDLCIAGPLRRDKEGKDSPDNSLRIPFASLVSQGPLFFYRGFDNHWALKDFLQRLMISLPAANSILLKIEGENQFYQDKKAAWEKDRA